MTKDTPQTISADDLLNAVKEAVRRVAAGIGTAADSDRLKIVTKRAKRVYPKGD